MVIYSIVAESTDGNGDYALCKEADVCISILGPPIFKVYKFHALEDGQVNDTKRVIERVLEQVKIHLDHLQCNPDPSLLCDSRCAKRGAFARVVRRVRSGATERKSVLNVGSTPSEVQGCA